MILLKVIMCTFLIIFTSACGLNSASNDDTQLIVRNIGPYGKNVDRASLTTKYILHKDDALSLDFSSLSFDLNKSPSVNFYAFYNPTCKALPKGGYACESSGAQICVLNLALTNSDIVSLQKSFAEVPMCEYSQGANHTVICPMLSLAITSSGEYPFFASSGEKVELNAHSFCDGASYIWRSNCNDTITTQIAQELTQKIGPTNSYLCRPVSSTY